MASNGAMRAGQREGGGRRGPAALGGGARPSLDGGGRGARECPTGRTHGHSAAAIGGRRSSKTPGNEAHHHATFRIRDPVSDRSNLAATIDGTPLSDEEARDLWTRFSRHMDEHRGDAAGFARANGYVSVTPTFDRGRALLVIRTTEAPPEPRATRPAGDRPPARPGGGWRSARGRRRR